MNILHISDLHVTKPFNSLDEVWNGPSAVVANEVYDFILVSGDLSQRAAEEEYQQLLAFTARLLDHVHDRDPRRVIFVPGNHDVDWGADLGSARPFKEVVAEAKAEPRAFLRQVLQDPMSSGYRARLSDDAEVEVVKLVQSRYPSRFARVQRFFDSFYVDLAGRADFRAFKLTDPDETRHFSAHLFARENVAFYGFNSCHGNDKYWTGAYISRTAINAAAEHARTHAKDMLHVAVWHHGLSGTPGRPDRLTMLDIGALHNAGFRIGFHGHTHRAETETLDRFFGDRFTVISTGSIGAGAPERPDAVGNQFSLVRLHLGQVTVTVYERDGEHGVFGPREPRFHLLPLEPLRPARLRHVRRHQLSWTVRENGIADLEVTLEKLNTDGPVTLARVPAAAGNVRGEATVETPLGSLPVIDATHPDGRREMSFQTQSSVLEKASWSARIAHAVALDAQELTLLPRGRVVTAALPPNEEGVCCEIDLATDVLEVAVRLPPACPGIERAAVACVVERRRNDGGTDRWERVPEEEHRCKNAVVMFNTHTLTATLEAPLVGYRYTFAWRPMPRRDVTWDDDAFAVSRWVIERCRRGHFGDPGWSHKLAHTVSEGIAASLDGFESARIAWMGFLWLEEERSLLAAFGRGPSSLWGARFPAGTGVAGHAFRFGLPAVWHQRGTPEASMIYRPSSESRSILGIEYPYQWIICVPIVTHARQPIGVVSMSGGPPETDAEFLMATLAERARKGTLNEELTQVQNSLVAAVNYGFWHTLARTPLGEQSPPFPEYLRRRAEQEETWADADFSDKDDTDAR